MLGGLKNKALVLKTVPNLDCAMQDVHTLEDAVARLKEITASKDVFMKFNRYFGGLIGPAQQFSSWQGLYRGCLSPPLAP